MISYKLHKSCSLTVCPKLHSLSAGFTSRQFALTSCPHFKHQPKPSDQSVALEKCASSITNLANCFRCSKPLRIDLICPPIVNISGVTYTTRV